MPKDEPPDDNDLFAPMNRIGPDGKLLPRSPRSPRLRAVAEEREAKERGATGTPPYDNELFAPFQYDANGRIIPRLKEAAERLAARADQAADAPPESEMYYWKNGWGEGKSDICANISKFYRAVTTQNGFKVYQIQPGGVLVALEKKDFLSSFERQRVVVEVASKNTGMENKVVTIGQAWLYHWKCPHFPLGTEFNPDPNYQSDGGKFNLF
jgi:hypothetical protein